MCPEDDMCHIIESPEDVKSFIDSLTSPPTEQHLKMVSDIIIFKQQQEAHAINAVEKILIECYGDRIGKVGPKALARAIVNRLKNIC